MKCQGFVLVTVGFIVGAIVSVLGSAFTIKDKEATKGMLLYFGLMLFPLVLGWIAEFAFSFFVY